VITGGAGFIGTNLADRLLHAGWHVTLFDNLSRPGVDRNVAWLRQQHGARVSLDCSDVLDRDAVQHCITGLAGQRRAAVFHFAAQVAVTTSLVDPRFDSGVNIGGTLNVLESLRRLDAAPPLIFTSTNKVYGSLSGFTLRRRERIYQPADATIAMRGIAEDQPLDFHSPYGCSKGAADQYVLDYARCFDLRSAVFRMSCIYGPHQCGTEDQGWVAHFLRQVQSGKPITLFGDGSQVRDILFVDDLVDALLAAVDALSTDTAAHEHPVKGQAFNIGGGPERAVSLLDFLELVEEVSGLSNRLIFADWRQGDQRWYVSNSAKFRAATGWRPRVTVREGIRRLLTWLEAQRAEEPGVHLSILRTHLDKDLVRTVWDSDSLADGSAAKELSGATPIAAGHTREGQAL
jgi:CDP-paratose 2-epimerase